MNNKQQDPLCVNLPISGNISTNSHDGSDLKNIATCSAASSTKERKKNIYLPMLRWKWIKEQKQMC